MFSVFRNCKAGDTPSLSLSRQSSATRLRGYQGRSLCRWKPVAGACEIAESLGRNFKHGVFWRGIDKYLQNVSCALWHDAKGLRKREDETECLGEDCRRTAAACYWFLCSRYRLFDSWIMIIIPKIMVWKPDKCHCCMFFSSLCTGTTEIWLRFRHFFAGDFHIVCLTTFRLVADRRVAELKRHFNPRDGNMAQTFYVFSVISSCMLTWRFPSYSVTVHY